MTDRLDRRIREIVVEVAEASPAPPDFRDVVGANLRGGVTARRPRRHKAWTRAAVALVALVSLAAAGLLVWARVGGDQRVGVTTQGRAGRPGWRELPAGPLEARSGEVSVWTGRQLIVWGGASLGSPSSGFADGARYDTQTRRWHRIPASPLSGRFYSSAVWTGREMIVWGGSAPGAGGALFADGAAYNPKSNRWRVLPAAPLDPRVRAVAVWSGSEVIVWGGSTGSDLPPQNASLLSGAAYAPKTRSWRPIAVAPFDRADQPTYGAWTGSEMIIWAIGSPTRTRGSAAYQPRTDTWRTLPPSPVTQLGGGEPPVWTGTQLIVPGAQLKRAVPGDTWGAAYDARSDTWHPIAAAPPAMSCNPNSAWTGHVVLVYCGAATRAASPVPARVAAYDPKADEWQTLDPPPAPIETPASAWTGRELIIWGVTRDANGDDHAAAAAYRPSTRRLGRSETGGSAAPACGSELPRPLAIPQGYNGPHARGIRDAPTPASATQLVQSWTATTGDIEVRWPADPPLAASFPPQDPPAPSPGAVGAVTPNKIEQAPSGRFFNYIVFSLRDQQPDCQTLQVSVFDTDDATVAATINQIRQTPFASNLPLIAGSRTVDAAPSVVPCRTPPGVSSPNRGGPITGADSHSTPAVALQGFVESDPTLPRNSYQELRLPDGSIAYAWQNPAGDWVIVIHVTPTNGTWTVDNWNASGC
jgi:hypothetical protein